MDEQLVVAPFERQKLRSSLLHPLQRLVDAAEKLGAGSPQQIDGFSIVRFSGDHQPVKAGDEASCHPAGLRQSIENFVRQTRTGSTSRDASAPSAERSGYSSSQSLSGSAPSPRHPATC